MGKGGQNIQTGDSIFTWEEVQQHDKRSDKWVVIDNEVYDITEWSRKHPGGSKVISHYAGQDATEAFRAFHNDLPSVKKYMKAIHRGHVASNEKDEEIKQDFDKLRETAKQMGLFTPSVFFFITNLLHLVAMETAAYFVMSYFGTTWLPFMTSVFLNAAVQAQAGWSQHDYGHLSVFKSSWMNHLAHYFTMNFTKGASRSWWNHLHYQHHAKPNVLHKDPDVRLDALFVLGEEMPKRVAAEKKRSMPYNWQHRYFFIIGPPLLFPIYFQYMIFKHPYSRRQWSEIAVMCLFYLKMYALYSPMLGLGWTMLYYFLVRCIESHWFVWVSQSNHIPMEIADDKARPWLPLQLHATCNVEKGVFNDWFTGHLNFQIEHHLFPTMPRHNLYKISPLVKSLCEKHGVTYMVKSLHGAFSDIVGSLKHSGEIWHAYYHAYHMS